MDGHSLSANAALTVVFASYFFSFNSVVVRLDRISVLSCLRRTVFLCGATQCGTLSVSVALWRYSLANTKRHVPETLFTTNERTLYGAHKRPGCIGASHDRKRNGAQRRIISIFGRKARIYCLDL